MKIKNKLRLGIGFLFVAVLLFGGMALYYIQQIANRSKAILKNNYETLSYTKAMRSVLDENALPLSAKAIIGFDTLLRRQEKNITEPGEKQATAQLRQYFMQLIQAEQPLPARAAAERQVRRQVRTIESLNMQAIFNKNDRAAQQVNHATLLLSLVGSFLFLVLFSFTVNFPQVIAGPLHVLIDGIREISQKNYSQRLHFTQNDEFGELASAFNTMAARLNDWENSNLATVMSEKRRIETIIEQMRDAIIGVNEKQEILFMNDAARQLLNLKDGKIVGHLTGDLTRSNDLLNHVLSGKNSGEPFKIVVNGKESYFQLERRNIVVPNLNNAPTDGIRTAGLPAGTVYVLKNVTEFKERDEAKTNFIATISHELKTPIASIKMSLKLLQDKRVGEVNTEQQELLEHIQDDNNRLLKITSELLNLSQVETGNIQLNIVPVKPGQIVHYALTAVHFQAEQKGVTLSYQLDEQLPAVQADVEKTAWVLVNFLSNALRYSPERSTIQIKTLVQNGYVAFTVTDQGKGIDEQYQKRLFDRYFQVPTDGQNKAGSGLGLAIAKDFIEAQNGSIWVQSAIGEGSTFGFSLPVV